MLEPAYGIGVDSVLDEIENDDSRSRLYNRIVEKLNFVCDHPDSAQARQHAIRLESQNTIWLVTVREPSETEDWGILWTPEGGDALFLYIGPWPPAKV
ncbi:hypothetical protein [Actinoplanes derwentensis]|uniref:Uncharacterized protein n=1 Tax=Actinoplanes derwentensis TaxID=113562 RepID=A0A1H2CE41_9ACTN|nr:hypothetical protein [Actinoplanes derwentensis]GID87375.1 hypothetical protein Ade03nite_62990 [Actinoplanes derwentensis]SDT68507.1 hypothetical protein SAMN04489716_5634 [Actinoplanes derwentensis]